MSQELKPCPFCGAIPDENDVGDYFVECPSCGITGPLGSKESLSSSAEAWNRRAPDPRASKSNISEYVEMLIGKPAPRDEVIRLCEKALESMGVLATAIQQHPDFDGEFNEAPTPLLYIVGKTLLGVNEALAAIKSLERGK